jgi:hypothetical protein
MPTKHANPKRKWIDPDDAPELTGAELARAVHYDGNRLLRRSTEKRSKIKPRSMPAKKR